MERDAFETLKPVIQRMRCPACGSEHVWSRGTARWRSNLPGAIAKATPEGEVLPTRPKDILDGLEFAEAGAAPLPAPDLTGSRRISALVTKLMRPEK
ncbi:MAG: hypothetical protein J0H94_21295 [Rhizobiales bacterium]|jgi:hypothetical protein|nr:hypothetical protein [Hyphomicrobiales bacterium]